MYPWYEDNDFNLKLLRKKEFKENDTSLEKIPKRCIENYQYLVSNFINPSSPYRSLLLYFSVGTGKSLAGISVAENFINEGSKKILVITKNQEFIKNFKNEYLNVCQDRPADKAKFRLDSRYKFTTYRNINKIQNFNNTVVIIDEVHNILGNEYYKDIMKVIDNSGNSYKLLLLSATPIVDNLRDVLDLSNLLNGKYNQITKASDFLEKEKYDTSNLFLYSDKIIKLSDQGQKSILNRLKGKVSYLKAGNTGYPKTIEMGDDTIEGTKLSVKVIKCIMSGTQEQVYKKLMSGINFKDFKITSTIEYASSMIYPIQNGEMYMSSRGFDKYIVKGRNYNFLKYEYVKEYSTKLYSLLQNLRTLGNGKAYIFSKYITADGIRIIKECLNANGYKKILYISSESFPMETLEKFNSPENDNGKHYNIILASKIISEGYTFKSIRQVHIYEPEWNLSSIDQIIGRAVRKNSHASLPVSDRDVKIFRYCAIPNYDYRMSLDFSKYLKASRKDVYIKKFERALMKASFSCDLFKNINKSSSNVDGSRECYYENCDYECDTKNDGQSDSSTYKPKYHNKEHYKIIVDSLKMMFNKYKTLTIEDIKKLIKIDQDIESILKHDPPFPIAKKGKYYYVPDNVKLNAVGNVIKNTSPTKVRGFIEGEVFKLSKNGRLGTSCLSFKKDELLIICQQLGLVVDKKFTKKQLCDELQKILNI